jgi:hypothetical protein
MLSAVLALVLLQDGLTVEAFRLLGAQPRRTRPGCRCPGDQPEARDLAAVRRSRSSLVDGRQSPRGRLKQRHHRPRGGLQRPGIGPAQTEFIPVAVDNHHIEERRMPGGTSTGKWRATRGSIYRRREAARFDEYAQRLHPGAYWIRPSRTSSPARPGKRPSQRRIPVQPGPPGRASW